MIRGSGSPSIGYEALAAGRPIAIAGATNRLSAFVRPVCAALADAAGRAGA